MARPVNVLMVEDSENDADLVLRELRRQGFAPTAVRVETGPALLAALEAHAWDVVISDHNMPNFDGTEALRLVKEHAPEVPFIVVSGTRGEEHAVEAMRSGASDFIVKTRLHRLAPVVERELQEAELRLEQRRMAAALAESQQQLRQAQKLEAVGRLAGGVAHDFNNILAVILGYADLVLKSMPAGDAHRADIQEIKRASARAAELTRQLLAFSRQQVLEQSSLNVNEIIADVLQLFKRLVAEHVAIELQTEDGLWDITGDRIRIEQILMNLVANARDAMPGGGTLTLATKNVEVSAPNQLHKPPVAGQYVRLDVRDTGEGIAEDVLPKIFDPFFTTKEEGKGTGLGLATVHGIVEQSGGYIFVDSQPHRGTAFTIYLPRTSEARHPEPATSTISEAAIAEERILLVENDPVARELIARMLLEAGYQVTVADGPEQALSIADSAPVHLLVTPITMSAMTGMALADRLRASHPNLPSLFIAGANDAKIDPLEVFDLGDILVTPYAPVDLILKVREALSTAHS